MMERTLRSYWPGLLFGLAILLTVPILWRVVLPTLSGANWGQHGDHLFLVMAHALGGLAMLGFGSAALFIGWTRRGFAWHRTVGRCYLILGSVGALGAIGLGVRSPHAPHSLYIATSTLAIFWLAFAFMAWRAVRNRRIDSHRQWMIRSYVLGWTFVGCRTATMVDFYPWLGAEGTTAAIWVNWIVPILVCEMALQWKAGARLRA